jgi:proteasome assembly chaperone (PAC2) family protein
MNIKDAIMNALAPLVKLVVKETLKAGLKQLFANDPQAAKTVVASLYPVMDVPVENATLKTETDMDDAVVDGVKEALEDSAKDWGIELPNLDDD